jgi:hypothetical protein
MFNFRGQLCRIIAIAGIWLACAGAVSAQSTTFTYQGRLNDTNGPVNGTYEFQFALYDAVSAGNLIAGPLTVLPVTVTNGLFTVNLDFGAASFNGANRWLDICVGPFPLNTNVHVYLSPRLRVNSTPYSIQALSATSVGGTTNVPVVNASGQMIVHAPGGYQFFTGASTFATLPAGASAWSVPSDRNVKKNFSPLDGKEVLSKLDLVPVSRWNYNWEADGSTPNIGPVAQDFKGAFFPGRDDKSISTLEFDGVELAAIKGLHQMVKEKDAQIADLQKRLSDLEEMVKALATKNK